MAFEIRDDVARIECPEYQDTGALNIEAWREPDGCLGMSFEWGARQQHKWEGYVMPDHIEDFIRAVRWAAAYPLGRLAIEVEQHDETATQAQADQAQSYGAGSTDPEIPCACGPSQEGERVLRKAQPTITVVTRN